MNAKGDTVESWSAWRMWGLMMTGFAVWALLGELFGDVGRRTLAVSTFAVATVSAVLVWAMAATREDWVVENRRR